MKNFTKIALSGIVCFVLAACGSSSSSSDGGTPPPPPPPPVPNDINYTALTGTGGYKINTDINGSIGQTVDIYPIDFYFCPNSSDGYDYFAVDSNTTPDWNGTTLPDDYGWNNVNNDGDGHLVFTTDSGNIQSVSYTITEDNNQTLTEGETYTLQIEGQTGTIKINTISDFNCSILPQALPVP